MTSRKGQVALYFLFAIIAIFIFALVNVDAFLAVREKMRIETAGDAAALAAAAKQGAALNDIARLNIEHIVAAMSGDSNECARIELAQRRIALLEPVYALKAASDAAKKNSREPNDDFSRILLDHVRINVRNIYVNGDGDTDPYPESYPGAWGEYAAAIENVCREGLAAGADNVRFHSSQGSHLLLNRDFYNAISARDWCWFLFHCEGTLNNYTSFTDWGPLDTGNMFSTENSEIFSLHLQARECALTDVFTQDEIAEMAKRYAHAATSLGGAFEPSPTNLLSDASQTWFFYDSRYWDRWFDGRRLAFEDGESGYRPNNTEFPILGTIKEEYNVSGAAAVCRVTGSTHSFANDTQHALSWSAAAKPFGVMTDLRGDKARLDAVRAFVLPFSCDARLVPVDSVEGASLATADFGWAIHVRDHLGPYLANGPGETHGCWYCAQLKRWENDVWRKMGITWLKYHAGECFRPVNGGPSGTGGTSHGH